MSFDIVFLTLQIGGESCLGLQFFFIIIVLIDIRLLTGLLRSLICFLEVLEEEKCWKMSFYIKWVELDISPTS